MSAAAAETARDGIRALLAPRSIAVVGASPRLPEAIRCALRGGGRAWGVHPTRDEVLGLPCRPSVAELPEPVELALLAVGHARIEAAFEEAAAAGVRAFVVPGLGNEAGPQGGPIAARLAARAQELGAAMVGPNCMGVAVAGGISPWIGTIPDTFVEGHVSAIVQSGSIGDALVTLGPRVGFRVVVSSGAEAVRDAADFLAFLAADAGTRAVGLFLETVRRPAAFAAALRACAEAGKPVACLKVGRSAAGARAALAHTGAVVGSDRAFSALLRRYGAIEVDDFQELVEVLEILGRRRWPRGRRVAAISESGGECALLADRGQAAGLPFAPLPDDLARRLREAFPHYPRTENPLDAWAVDAVERVFPGSLRLLVDSGAFDVVLAQADLTQFRGAGDNEWVELVLRALAAVTAGTDVFAAVTTVHGGDPPPHIQAAARELDVALLRGADHTMRALSAVAGRGPVVPPEIPAAAPVDLSDLLRGAGALPEHESATALERYGVPLAERRRARTPEEAARAAAQLGPPVVVKVDGPAHKNARGGVVTGVCTPADAAAAAERLGGRVLVARQVPPGPETLVGMVRDPAYGPVLAVGRGGADVEAFAPAVALGPLDREQAAELVRAAGLPPSAQALADVVVAVSRLAADHPQVAEVDVNPLILGADGPVAVDALLVVGDLPVDRGPGPQ